MMTEKELKKQVLAEHIQAFRKSLIISVGAILVCFVVAFYAFSEPIIQFVLSPLHNRGIEPTTIQLAEGIISKLKACLIVGVIAAMPIIMWQIWSFISPALYPNEKKIFVLLFFIAFVLFIVGVVFATLYVFPLMLDLFYETSEDIAKVLWTVQQYFDTSLSFILPFGFVFELPVAIYMMARKGWVTYTTLAKNRKFVILAIAVIAGFLTPPDVVSQTMLGLPMVLLYEVSVQIARFVKPKKQPQEEHPPAAA